MLQTTAQRFGSLGKSFGAPAAAAAVIGAALLASDTSDTSETAWSPAAACLLPDVLPVAGTLLSYGGNRQLAAGGTVTHSGALNLGANALTCGAITASGQIITPNTYIDFTSPTVTTTLWRMDHNIPGYGSRLSALYNGNITTSLVGRTDAMGVEFNANFGDAFVGSTVIGSGDGTKNGLKFKSLGNGGGITLIASNNSGVMDPILRFGGTTSSYPAIKRSGTTTAFRLADDSADGPISCGAITASAVTLSAQYPINLGSRAYISSQLDSEVTLHDSAVSGYAALKCGAITASGNLNFCTDAGFTQAGIYIDLVRAGMANYTLRLGGHTKGITFETTYGLITCDDRGGYALQNGVRISSDVSRTNGILEINNGTAGTLRDLSCRTITASGTVTASGTIQETPTQSSLDPTTTNIPSGKRMGWYNSTLSEFRDWVNIGGTLLKSAAYT